MPLANSRRMNIDIPNDLHKELKIQAAQEGRFLSVVLRDAMQQYLKRANKS